MAPQITPEEKWTYPVVSYKWFLPHEGQLTILWKIAWANVYSFHELRQLLCLNGGALPLPERGRVLKFLSYPPQSDPDNPDLLIRPKNLGYYSSRWADILQSENFRYCSSCLLQGYQSPIHQIEGIYRCPIHGDPLSETCPVCNAPTQPYSVKRESFLNPFHCDRCGSPFSGDFNPANFFKVADLASHAVKCLKPIARWLRRLEASQFSWPVQQRDPLRSFDSLKFVDWTLGLPPVEAFHVARQLVPIKINQNLLATNQNLTHIRVGNRSAACRCLRSRNSIGVREPQRADTKAIYKAVKRYLYNRFVRRHKRCVRGVNCVLMPSWTFGQPSIEFPEPACIFAASFILWRLRSEDASWVMDSDHFLGMPLSMKRDKQWKLKGETYYLGTFPERNSLYEDDFDLNQWTEGLLKSFYSCLNVLANVMRTATSLSQVKDPKNRHRLLCETASQHGSYLLIDRWYCSAMDPFYLTPADSNGSRVYTYLFPNTDKLLQFISTEPHYHVRRKDVAASSSGILGVHWSPMSLELIRRDPLIGLVTAQPK